MKPRNITISAFGPYSHELRIDFDDLGSNGVFLVTGDTGAGKTTIFDALSYALYGEASGSLRSTKNLRSDFASPMKDTFVECMFTHKGTTWRVKRNPAYEGLSKRGSKPKMIAAAAELENMDTHEIFTGITEVRDRIIDIIGLTHEQFVQTVMIPQGEFMKILTASSDERKKLFQKVFNTGFYARLQEQLKNAKTAADEKHKKLQDEIIFHGKRISIEEDYKFKESIAAYRTEPENVAQLMIMLNEMHEEESARLAEIRKQLAEYDEKIPSLASSITAGKALNDRFDELEKLMIEKEAHKKALPEIEKMKLALDAARRAAELELDEGILREKHRDYMSLTQKAVDAKAAFEKYTAEVPVIKAALEEAKAKSGERDRLITEADRLDQCIPTVKRVSELARELKAAEARKANAFAESVKAENEYRSHELNYYLNQVGELAKTLEEGTPCPVCGSIHHPNPAQQNENSVTREEVKASEERRDMTLTVLNKINEKIAELTKEYDIARSKLAELGLSESVTENDINSQMLAVRREVSGISERIDYCEKQFRIAQNNFINAKTALDNYKAQADEAAETEKQLTAKFIERVMELGFDSTDAYKVARKPLAERRSLENQINTYNEKAKSLSDNIAEREKYLEGRSRVDISELEAKRSKLEQCKSKLTQHERALAENERANRDALAGLKGAVRNIDRMREDWGTVSELYNLVSGQNGKNGNAADKLTFEVYVQQYYFKQVIAAANSRMRTLTAGRFSLRCMQNARDRRSQAGLDLEVWDNSTGTWRDVTTLSGGESFLTSLALAIGLSDIVQAQSGGIRLEAMFIDEGFGSLDDTALKNALELLDKLADGDRIIGVISHVNELAERIDKKIMVRRTNSGSRIQIIA